MDGSGHVAAHALPGSWSWERFVVVNAGDGYIALYNQARRKFVRINGGDMDCNGPKAVDQLPGGWTWERFKEVRSPANFGLRISPPEFSGGARLKAHVRL